MSQWFQLTDDVFFDENVEGVFILSGSGDVFALEDDVSKAVWNFIAASPQSMELVCRHIRQTFEISADDCVEDDIRDFVSALTKIGVLIECPEPAAKIS